MKITDVERFEIPIEGFGEGRTVPEGTSVEELIQALKKLPPKGIIARNHHNSNIVVIYHKPEIDSECTDGWLQDSVWRELMIEENNRRSG